MDTTTDDAPALPEGPRSRTASQAAATRRPAAPRLPSGAPVWQWALALSVAAGVNGAMAVDAVSPVQTKDEIGYLMAARLLGGGGGADLVMPPYAGGYSAGWGLLLAPLWALVDHPVRFFHAAVGANVVMATLAVVVWVAVARRLGAGPRASLVVATLVAVAPGRALYTGYALPEALLGILVAGAFWLVLRLWDDPAVPDPDGLGARPVAARTGTAWALAALVSYLSLVHSRFLPAVGLLLVVLAWWAWRARARGGVLVVGAGAAGALAGVLVNRWVEDVLYGEVDRFVAAGEQIGQLHGGFMASLTVGHAWYGAVAWGGLTVVGAVWATGLAVAELRRRSPGPATVLLLLVLTQLVVGAVYLSTRIGLGAGRFDQLVYGRYMDPVWALLAVVGLSALATGRAGPAVLRRSVVVVLVLGAGVGVVLLALGGIVGGLVQLNVPGIEMWRWVYGEDLRVPFVQATAAAVVLLVGVGWARTRGVPREAVAGLLLVAAVAGTVVAEARTIDPRDQRLRDLFSLREVVEQDATSPVVLVVDRPLLLTATAFQYWLGDREYRVVDPEREAVKIEPGELVIGTLYPRPLMIGAPRELLEIDPTYRYGVWKAAGGPVDPDRL